MLRLRSQAIHRLGKAYTCPSCLAAARPPVAVSVRPSKIASSQLVYTQTKNRLFTTSARLSSEDVETAKDVVPEASGSSEKAAPNPPEAVTRAKAKKKKKSPAKTPPEKIAPASADQSQHLAVLQGALAALKKVLEQQNIHYGGTKAGVTKEQTEPKKTQKKPQKAAKSQPDQKPRVTLAEAKPKAKTKATPKAKTETKTEAKSEEKAEEKAEAANQQPKSNGRRRKRKPSPPSPPSPKISPKKKQAVPKMDDVALLNAALLRSGVSIGALQASPSESKEPKNVPTKGGGKKGVSSKPVQAKKVPAKNKSTKNQADSPKKSKLEQQPLQISNINANELNLVPIDKPQPPVPALSYGLERALFNPGVYYLQDPRSKVYNFDPYLSNIMPIKEFDFDALKQYITSSKDETLIGVAREHGKKYTGSTSSMTAALSHFHYLLSSWREINSGMMSQEFQVPNTNFTRLLRSPAATFLHYKDGVYAIDADKEFDSANILSMLGKSMEKLLTLPKEEYEKYRRVNSHQISEEERNADEAYHYTGLGDFMMRSQLDAHDPRVPGTGMFDLKTRAVISIRMDVQGYEKGLGYELRHRHGNWESYEREYHDMIRAAFLKYSLQVRMGRMDGIFVAFHNTQRIFGFQYIPLGEMDLSLHGTSDTALGDKEFKLSLTLFNQLLDRATAKFPETSLRLFVETRESNVAPFMYAFFKPVTPEEIESVQSKNKDSVEVVERQLRGITDAIVSEARGETEMEEGTDGAEVEEKIDEAEAVEGPRETEIKEEEEDEDEDDDVVSWGDIQLMVEDAMEDDELGIGAVRQAIEDALEESGLLEDQNPEEARGYVDALLSVVTDSSQRSAAESADVVDDEAEQSAAESTDIVDDEAQQSAAENTDVVDDEAQQSAAENTDVVDDEAQQSAAENTDVVDDEAQQSAAENIDVVTDEAQATSELEATEVETAAPENTESVATRSEQVEAEPAKAFEEATSEEAASKEAASEEAASQEAASQEVASQESPAENDLDESESKDAESKDLDGESASPNMSTLSNLIVRMTRQIDEKGTSEEQPDAAVSSKLKEFERILSKIISESREDDQATDSNTVPDAVDETPALADKVAAETTEDAADPSEPVAEEAGVEKKTKDKFPLLGMVLTVRNKVNGKYVTRPENLTKDDVWEVEYNIEELPDGRAHRLFMQCQRRRKTTFKQNDKEKQWNTMFGGALPRYTKEGRDFRDQENEQAKKQPIHIVGQEKPLSYNEIFGDNGKEA